MGEVGQAGLSCALILKLATGKFFAHLIAHHWLGSWSVITEFSQKLAVINFPKLHIFMTGTILPFLKRATRALLWSKRFYLTYGQGLGFRNHAKFSKTGVFDGFGLDKDRF